MKVNQYTTLLVKDRAIKYDQELNSAAAVAKFLDDTFRAQQLPTEHFWQICLNRRLNAVGVFEASIGCDFQTIVDVPTIARNAILTGAGAVIIAHNHPSGSLEFSGEDVQITKQLREALKLFSINLADHVIIARGTFASLKQQGGAGL